MTRQFLCVLALFAGAGPAQAERYSVTDLGTLGGRYSTAADINDAGQVVGTAATADDRARAFLWSGGTMKDLGSLGNEWSRGFGINSLGQVVGISSTSWGPGRGFLYSGGKMTELGSLPGGESTYAIAINDAGQIAGHVETRRSPYSGNLAFLMSNGQMRPIMASHANAINAAGQMSLVQQWFDGKTILPLPRPEGSDHIRAEAINDAGQLVGAWRDRNGHVDRAFLYKDGKLTNLGTLPAMSGSRAYGVNDLGQIVGSSYPGNNGSSDVRSAFLYRDGKMVDLNSLIPPDSHLKLLDALAINNQGQIVGQARTASGEFRAFLLTPVDVPEPTSLALLGLGAASLAGYAWRRRGRPRTPAAA